MHGRTGLLAKPNDDDGFRHNLVRVLQDSELRGNLSAGAREDAGRFGAKAHADALTRIYEQVLRARRDPPEQSRDIWRRA